MITVSCYAKHNQIIYHLHREFCGQRSALLWRIQSWTPTTAEERFHSLTICCRRELPSGGTKSKKNYLVPIKNKTKVIITRKLMICSWMSVKRRLKLVSFSLECYTLHQSWHCVDKWWSSGSRGHGSRDTLTRQL